MSARRVQLAALLGLTVALLGCPKPGDGDKPPPAPSASAKAPAKPELASSVDASAPARDASAPASGGGATGAAAASYAGTYSVTPAAFYISDAKDFASVKQVKDDPSKHVGDGAIEVAVDADGRVLGTIASGPAGPAVIEGVLRDGELRGIVRRKDPKDDGLTGTLVAKVAGENVDGKLALAEFNAAIVREGKLSLKKK